MYHLFFCPHPSFSKAEMHNHNLYKGFEVEPTLKMSKILKGKQVLQTKKSSEFFLNWLNSVVLKTEYTGPRVKINGYQVGGKTGTSELINPRGGYYKDRNLTSFIAVFPINNPKYVIYTAVEYPKKMWVPNKEWPELG